MLILMFCGIIDNFQYQSYEHHSFVHFESEVLRSNIKLKYKFRMSSEVEHIAHGRRLSTFQVKIYDVVRT